MVHAGRPETTAAALAMLLGFAISMAGGCVTQSTYDAAVQEAIATKAELGRAKEEQRILARQVSDMELLNADAVREAEAATASPRQAQEDAEHERQQLERYLAKLKQRVAQAGKQQRALEYELTVARENAVALQELVDVHQRKLRDGAVPAAAAEPAVHKPFDPATIPVPQDLPAAPVVTAPATPVPATTTAPAKAVPPPTEDDWLTSIKNWLVSLWRSVF